MSALTSNLATIRESLVPLTRSIACAESVTVGNVQRILAATSGASDFFLGGITTYNIDQKVRHLGIDREHASSCDCVSERVVVEMAHGACRLFDADYAVATTGYAEPYPAASVDKAFAYAAIVSRRGDEEWKQILAPSSDLARVPAQEFFAEQAVQLVAATLPQWIRDIAGN